jgi:PPOX class probable F420-dependent enzyme
MATIPGTHLDILRSTALAYVATVGPNGEPQVSPVWFGWNDKELFFSMNKIRRRYRNLLRDKRVAVAIADPANPYRSLEVRGVARIDDDPTHHFPNALSQKYLERDTTLEELSPIEERVVVFVAPEDVVVFPFQPSPIGQVRRRRTC